MQAVTLYVDMCCCSCEYSDKLSLCLQQVRTGDLGGYATSDEFTRAVIANLTGWALYVQICQLLSRAHAVLFTSC